VPRPHKHKSSSKNPKNISAGGISNAAPKGDSRPVPVGMACGKECLCGGTRLEGGQAPAVGDAVNRSACP
jgi:hypothetical protein